MYNFDVHKSGEAVTRPDLRTTPLREAVYTKLVRNVLQARHKTPDGVTPTLGADEVGVLWDGGRRGNATRLLAPWQDGTSASKSRKKKSGEDDDGEGGDDDEEAEAEEEDTKLPGFVPALLQVVLTEESLAARRKFVRGTASIHQIQGAHIVSDKKICLPERPRKHYKGSNSGDTITEVDMPTLPGTEWHLTVRDKKKLYGKKNLIAVGGMVGSEGINPHEKRADDKKEPVVWWSYPEMLLAEIVHCLFVKLVFDLTPGDCKFAFVCLKLRIGYIGITFTEYHSQLLDARLFDLVSEAMADDASPLFNVQFAKLMLGDAPATTPPPAPKAKAKGRAKRLASDADPGEEKAPKAMKAMKAMKSKKSKAETADDDGDDDDEDESADISGSDDDDDDDDDVWDPLKDDDEKEG